MITRRANAQDVPELVALMRSFYAESSYALDAEWATQAFLSLLKNENYGALWLAIIDGESAGYVVMTSAFSMEFGGLTANIEDLYVLPEYRRRGAGQALLKELWAESRKRAVKAIRVELGPDNIAAQKLYAGFEMQLQQDERAVMVWLREC